MLERTQKGNILLLVEDVQDTNRELAIQETVMSRHGVDRVQKYAFELARSGKKKKRVELNQMEFYHNAIWDERFDIMANYSNQN